MAETRTDAGTTIVSTRKPQRSANLARWIAAVRQSHGKGYLAQIVEMARLARGSGRISAYEYYDFNLYDDARYSAQAKRAFLGQKARARLSLYYNDVFWNVLTSDKLVCSAYLASQDLATPPVAALAHPHRRHHGVPTLSDDATLASWLLNDAHYPLFGKPVRGTNGLGTSAIAAVDTAARTLTLLSGRTVALDDYLDAIEPFRERGYLFMPRLSPHAALVPLIGDRLPTLRLGTLMIRGEPRVFAAVLKIPVGNNTSDNFQFAGNLLADVDLASGRLGRVITGNAVDEREVAAHPDTGAAFAGVTLPLYEETRALALRGAAAFPRVLLLGWDIALAADGPTILEVNDVAALDLAQRAAGRGLLDDTFAVALAKPVRAPTLKAKL